MDAGEQRVLERARWVIPGVSLVSPLEEVVGAAGEHRAPVVLVGDQGAEDSHVPNGRQRAVLRGVERRLQTAVGDIVVRIGQVVLDDVGGARGIGDTVRSCDTDRRRRVRVDDVYVGPEQEEIAGANKRALRVRADPDRAGADAPSGIACRAADHQLDIGGGIASEHVELDQQADLVVIVAPLVIGGGVLVDLSFQVLVVIGSQRDPDGLPVAGEEAVTTGSLRPERLPGAVVGCVHPDRVVGQLSADHVRVDRRVGEVVLETSYRHRLVLRGDHAPKHFEVRVVVGVTHEVDAQPLGRATTENHVDVVVVGGLGHRRRCHVDVGSQDAILGARVRVVVGYLLRQCPADAVVIAVVDVVFGTAAVAGAEGDVDLSLVRDPIVCQRAHRLGYRPVQLDVECVGAGFEDRRVGGAPDR